MKLKVQIWWKNSDLNQKGSNQNVFSIEFTKADNIELFLLSLLHRESPYKRILTLLMSDTDSKSTTKDFTLFIRSIGKLL